MSRLKLIWPAFKSATDKLSIVASVAVTEAPASFELRMPGLSMATRLFSNRCGKARPT